MTFFPIKQTVHAKQHHTPSKGRQGVPVGNRWGRRLLVLLLCIAGEKALAVEELVVYPQQKGVQINRVFYDFKSPSAPREFLRDDWAKTLLIEYGFNGIRTSIYGTSRVPAHPEPGTIISTYYEAEIAGLKRAKKIRPDLLIFASKKLYKKESFPAWTKDGNGVIPKKYALLLFDYLRFMKEEGLPVDVLGIDNERGFNEGNIMPKTHRAIVEELRRLTRRGKVRMPKIVGHDDIGMARNGWMKTFNEVGGDTMDVFGSHYYPQWRHLERMKADLDAAGTREKWHTELHWDYKQGDDPFYQATIACLALWDSTDNGMNGLLWWAFNPKKTLRDYLMHALTVPLVNAWPVTVVDPDGAETVDVNQLHTRAFLQGDQLTLYAVNLGEMEWTPLRVKLASGQIVGEVAGRHWSDDLPKEGLTAPIKPTSNQTFYIKIAPRTINSFTLRLKP